MYIYIYICVCKCICMAICIFYTWQHIMHTKTRVLLHPGGHRWHERVLAGAGSVADWGPFGGQTCRASGLSSAQRLEGAAEWVENTPPELDGFKDWFIFFWMVIVVS